MRPFLLAVGFLTRIPTPLVMPEGRELARSMLWFPLVGLLLAVPLLGMAHLLSGVLSPLLVAAIVVALLAGLTGGLHLDGVADCFDALGVFGDTERRLTVMKDPRVGALGAVGLVMVLILKVLALAEAGPALPAVLLPALVLSRWTAVLLAATFPYARPKGTGQAMATDVGWVEVIGGGLVVLAVLGALGGWWAAGLALVGALLLAARMHRLLGGLTGDVYGAAVEVVEVVFFIALAGGAT
ncbi:MAG: adenosylcobinamide-GDP ribazoletransferase [Myxococcota bacterium]|nr:adenosylcobinamide-GDP ribazoletransferase [Myxococcota bacterium]